MNFCIYIWNMIAIVYSTAGLASISSPFRLPMFGGNNEQHLREPQMQIEWREHPDFLLFFADNGGRTLGEPSSEIKHHNSNASNEFTNWEVRREEQKKMKDCGRVPTFNLNTGIAKQDWEWETLWTQCLHDWTWHLGRRNGTEEHLQEQREAVLRSRRKPFL